MSPNPTSLALLQRIRSRLPDRALSAYESVEALYHDLCQEVESDRLTCGNNAYKVHNAMRDLERRLVQFERLTRERARSSR